ncbi:MAG: hypothetical protein WD770_05820 [Actinomycetota bacterium]
MTTSEIVMERALALAAEDTEREAAVAALLESADGRRVSVVLARQHLLDDQSETAARAVELLDEVIVRLPEV